MARNRHIRNEANRTEQEQRDQYIEDRRFIARFLENNLRGPLAATVLHRFWWYRCEDGEIEVVMGRKREYKRPRQAASVEEAE